MRRREYTGEYKHTGLHSTLAVQIHYTEEPGCTAAWEDRKNMFTTVHNTSWLGKKKVIEIFFFPTISSLYIITTTKSTNMWHTGLHSTLVVNIHYTEESGCTAAQEDMKNMFTTVRNTSWFGKKKFIKIYYHGTLFWRYRRREHNGSSFERSDHTIF